MKCILCKTRESETTDCRCLDCRNKPMSFGNNNTTRTYIPTAWDEFIDKETEEKFYKKVFETNS